MKHPRTALITEWGIVAGICLASLLRHVGAVARLGGAMNDGGMFARAASDILASGGLPSFLTYNFRHIPFAYPPLGIVILAFVSRIIRVSLADAVAYLPSVVHVISLGVFYLLIRDIFRNRLIAIMALIVYASVPDNFTWLIMGGGMTRSVGMTFALAALLLYGRYRQYGNNRTGLAGGVCLGMTALSHPEMAVFALYLIFASTVFTHKPAWKRFFLMAATGAAVTLPWLVWVVSTHGVSPFEAALRSRDVEPLHSAWTLFSGRLFPVDGRVIPTVLTVIGAGVLVYRKHILFPVLAVIIGLIDLSNSPTLIGIPQAVFIAFGLDAVAVAIGRVIRGYRTAPGRDGGRRRVVFRLLPSAGAGILLLWSLGVLMPYSEYETRTVTAGEKALFRWISRKTVPGDTFLVISGDGTTWELDPETEWFPVLTGRKSLTTVQGTEWLPGYLFGATMASYRKVQACTKSADPAACLSAVTFSDGEKPDYVLLLGDTGGWINPDAFSRTKTSLDRSRLYLPVRAPQRTGLWKRLPQTTAKTPRVLPYSHSGRDR